MVYIHEHREIVWQNILIIIYSFSLHIQALACQPWQILRSYKSDNFMNKSEENLRLFYIEPMSLTLPQKHPQYQTLSRWPNKSSYSRIYPSFKRLGLFPQSLNTISSRIFIRKSQGSCSWCNVLSWRSKVFCVHAAGWVLSN